MVTLNLTRSRRTLGTRGTIASVAGRLLGGGTRGLRISAIRVTGRTRHNVVSVRALARAGRRLVTALSRIGRVRARNTRGHHRTRTRLSEVRGRVGSGLLRMSRN